jgi:hypothetical protein
MPPSLAGQDRVGGEPSPCDGGLKGMFILHDGGDARVAVRTGPLAARRTAVNPLVAVRLTVSGHRWCETSGKIHGALQSDILNALNHLIRSRY